MKRTILGIMVFMLTILAVSFVSASLNIGPSKMYFNLNPNEQNCQKVILSSSDYSGTLKVRDVWTKNSTLLNVNKYDKTAEGLGMMINYPQQIENFQNQIEVDVCVIANKSGKFRGDLIFTPTSNTNIVVEVGTWLFVNVSGTPSQEAQIETPPLPPTSKTTTQETGNSPITGNVIASSGWRGSNIVWVVLCIIIIFIAVAFVYIKRRKRLKSEGFI